MFKATHNIFVPLLKSQRFNFSNSYQLMKNCIAKDLYSIELINKNVNRRILSMAYSPGVGAVC
jgi:malic enzyme